MASRTNLVTIPKSIEYIPVYGNLGKKIQIQNSNTEHQRKLETYLLYLWL
jgi:hypothetical protein